MTRAEEIAAAVMAANFGLRTCPTCGHVTDRGQTIEAIIQHWAYEFGSGDDRDVVEARAAITNAINLFVFEANQ